MDPRSFENTPCTLNFKNLTETPKTDSWSKAHLVPDNQEVLFQKAFKTHNLTTAPPHSDSESKILAFFYTFKNPLKLPLITVYHHNRSSRSRIINLDTPNQWHPLLKIPSKITQIHKSGCKWSLFKDFRLFSTSTNPTPQEIPSQLSTRIPIYHR